MSATGVGHIERLVVLGAAIAAGAGLPLLAGSAGPDGTDYVVSADANEEYLVEASIDGYARVVKQGAGNVVLRTTTLEYSGDVVIEEGALYIETAGSNELCLNGSLTGGTTSTSGIFFRKRGTGTLRLDGNVDLARSVQLDQGLMEMSSAASRAYRDGFIVKGDSRSLMGGGHTLLNWVRVGNDGRGVFHQTGGVLGVTGETSVAFAVSTPLTLSTFSGAGSVTGCDITVTDAVRATCEDIFTNKSATFAGKLTFAEGAAFEISDPENLRQYMRSGFRTPFQAQQILGSPVLRLAGSESCGSWALIRNSDGTYKFGAHAGTIIMVK